MSPFVRRPVSAFLFAAFALPALAAEPALAQRIANVEQGLTPAQTIKGAPSARRTLAEEMKRLNVPGVSIAVIHGGRLAWAKGYGVTREGGAPVTPATLFQAASISKPVAAMTALRMVQAGQLELDRDVNDYLSSWKLPAGPDGAKVTLRQLLSHTAGTSVWGFPGYAAGVPVPSVVQVLDGAAPANTKPVRVVTAPGSKWAYSGGGYTIVQQLLADRSGKSFADLAFETVLTPAGMHDSSFTQPASAAIAARAAQPHDGKGKAYAGGPYTHPELAAAGMWTTPSDLARFALALRGAADGKPDQLLGAPMAATMLTPVKNGYALGLFTEGEGTTRAFGHGGSNRGFQSSLHMYTEQGDGAIVMTNGDAGSELARGVLRAVAAEYNWPSLQTVERSAITLAPAAAKPLAGKYIIKELGDFEIKADDTGQLTLAIGNDKGEPLYAQSPTVFFILSKKLELHLDKPGDTDGGRLLQGQLNVAYTRVK